MPTFRCGRFPEGVVHIRTPDGQLVDFVDGVAQVTEDKIAAGLRKVPADFEITEDKPPRKAKPTTE